MAEQHRALRLEHQHAKQHAGGGFRVVNLDQAALALRLQPVGKRVFGPPDRAELERRADAVAELFLRGCVR